MILEKPLSKMVLDFFLDLLKSFAIAIIIFYALNFFFVFTIVEGKSMQPTFKEHERLVVNKTTSFFNNYERGDIIVFYPPIRTTNEKLFIKRVIAVPNDHLQIENGNVYIDGELLYEEYTNNQSTDTNEPIDIIIPEGYVFVLGDNRGNSIDSRFKDIGLIPFKNIKGKVLLRFYPFDRIEIWK